MALVPVKTSQWKPRSTGSKFTRDNLIPLTGVEVTGELIEFVGKLQISQTYVNNYPTNIEAKYLFNLDQQSVVTGMKVVIGDRVLVSQIFEKKEARQTYEKAITDKLTVCLLEKESNDIYTMNLGNILPSQEIKIEFEYLTKLECTDKGQMKFVLPTNISPKYDDKVKTRADVVATSATTTAMTFSPQKNAFTFLLNLNWKSKTEIVEVKSLTNEIEVTPLENTETSGVKGVKIVCTTAPSNGDFNVFVKTAIEPTLYVSMKGENTYLMLNQRIGEEYSAETNTIGAEYVILVDRSGSMSETIRQWSGNTDSYLTMKPIRTEKIHCAREAAEIFVSSLPPGSHFNIVSFGTQYSALFGGHSVEYTETTKNQALEAIAKFSADMGGTELLHCLSDVLSGQLKGGSMLVNLAKRVWTPLTAAFSSPAREKIIILMTDGDVGNIQAVTQLIQSYSANCRVFTIGIGQDVNRSLVEKIAKASNGVSEVLVDNPDISTVVVKMLDASMKSYYNKSKLRLLDEAGQEILQNGSEEVSKTVIYPNQFHSVYLKVPTTEFLKCRKVQLTCEKHNGKTGRSISWEFPINHSEDSSQENPWIPQLYAADLIRQSTAEDAKLSTAEIVQLSVEYSIMNAKTSFVVVDEETEVEKSSPDPLPVTVPQFSGATSSSDSVLQAQGLLRRQQMILAAVPDSSNDYVECGAMELQQQAGIFQRKSAALKQNRGGIFSKIFGSSSSSSSSSQTTESKAKEEEAGPPVLQTDKEKMDYLLKKFKKVDGSFSYSPDSLKIVGRWQASDILSFTTANNGISEELAFNLFIFKWLTCGSLSADKKYLLIVRNLEKWLRKQIEALSIAQDPAAKLSLDDYLPKVLVAVA